MVQLGAKVIAHGDHGHGYIVHILNGSGPSSEVSGLKDSGAVGIGNAVGKQVAKRLSTRWLVRQIGGFIGSRIAAGFAGAFIPNKMAPSAPEINELLPNGVRVRYQIHE
jgi:hypothetical protein